VAGMLATPRLFGQRAGAALIALTLRLAKSASAVPLSLSAGLASPAPFPCFGRLRFETACRQGAQPWQGAPHRLAWTSG
jgi:hypothetical protein